MKMVLNKSRRGQAVPPGLLYIQHFLVTSYKSIIFKKPHFFCFFFINVSSLESSSATVRDVRSLPIPKLQSHMPKHLALWHPLLFSQEAKATLISCCTYSTYTVPKNYDKKRTDTTVTPAITQTHKMP